MIDLQERIQLVNVPESVPQRGNRFTRYLGQLYTALIGWHFKGHFPDRAKMVLILAPHTSNVDFLVGLAPLFALGLRLSFMAKDSVFWGPLGVYLRWLGGVPIDRTAGTGYVETAIREFKERDRFILVITPEGTRTSVERWKTGFYHIARGADVPILPLVFDYSKHEVRFEELYHLSGDKEKDIAYLRSLYSASQARVPDNY